MPRMFATVCLIGLGLVLTNLVFFVILNHKMLIQSYSRYKRQQQIDEMLEHAVNKIEIKNNLRKYKGFE